MRVCGQQRPAGRSSVMREYKMKSRINHAASALLIFLLLSMVSLWATGNLHIRPIAPAATADEHTAPVLDACGNPGCTEAHAAVHEDEHHADHAHEHDDHAGHDHPVIKDPADLEAILKIECEHDILIADCDECRYEVGLVKIGPEVSRTLLEIEPVSERTMGGVLKLTGRIESDRARVNEVAAAAAGRVVAVEKLLGQKVKAGDVLAVIQSAELGRAKADYLEAQAQLKLAQSTFAREKQLHEKRISSQADFLTAQSELHRSEAALAAAEKTLNLLGLDAQQIAAIDDDRSNGRFGQLVLRAPSDGTIIEQNAITGKLVDSTETLFTIADLSSLWVWCDLYERDLARIHARLAESGPVKADVRIAAFPDCVFEGTLDLIDSTLNTRTRTVRVRLSLSNPDGLLKVGMFADARIVDSDAAVVSVVPKTAVMTDAGKSFVFQQIKEDLWFRRDVITGRTFDQYIEIESGLPHDARIVAKGAFMLKSDILREKMGAGCAH